MDFARKFNKPNSLEKYDRKMKSPRAIVSDGLIQKDLPIVEDRRLVNWKVWLSRRKKQYRDIEARTGRHSTDQLMNSCEKVRPKVEMRNIMEYAVTAAPVVPDKYSKALEFWHVPKALRNRGDPCMPEITVTPARRDLNLPPKLVHVGLPDLIKKEKDLASAKLKKMTWRQSAYLKEREEELANEIKRLVPKEPEIDQLAVQGRSYSGRNKWFSRIPPLKDIVPEEESYEIQSQSRADSNAEVILQIQGDDVLSCGRFSTGDQLNLKPITWTLHFNSVLHEITERKVVLRNKGLSPITCIWRKYNFQNSEIPLQTSVITPFYFNKNKIIIPEKEVIEIKVWYLPRSPGIFTELWQLFTKPKVSSAPLVFRFWGCSEEPKVKFNSMKFNPQSVDVYLNCCMRDSLIRLIIEEIMESIESPQLPEPAYRSLLLENDIFSCKNPEYFYHPSYVIELRDFYQNTTNDNTISWNLSLDDLRDVILQLSDQDQRLQMLNYFNQKCKELLKPTLHNSDNVSNKQEAVYNILCAFFNVFEMESEYARNVLTDVYNETKKFTGSHDLSATTVVSNKEQESKHNDTSLEDALTGKNTVDVTFFGATNLCYEEIFTIRIADILAETIDRVCAAIDSHHRLNYPEK